MRSAGAACKGPQDPAAGRDPSSPAGAARSRGSATVDSPTVLTDVIIVALTVALAVWGYSQGMSVGVMVAVGLAVGALLGSRIGPQILDGGLRDPLAPALSLPGALLLGGALGALSERFGFELRRRYLRKRYRLDAVGGALLAGFLGVMLVWVAGAVGARLDGLKKTVRGSEILAQLNSVLPPPGPLVSANRSYSLPVVDGPRARLRPASNELKHDPEVEAAARSVVKIRISGCGHRASGSGWVAADGIVVSNAHVVHGFKSFGVQVEGAGVPLDGTPILMDLKNDVSVLSVPGVKGASGLRIAGTPKVSSAAVVLGFPYGRHYKARPARIGPTLSLPSRIWSPRDYGKRLVTLLRADLGVGPGSSGGPLVDHAGRVVAMIFARAPVNAHIHYAIPSSSIKRDLGRALASRKAVDTGECQEA